MPPSAAPEWLRVGWILERSATSAPASKASIAARMPAQPAPITSTSCEASTREDAIGTLVVGACRGDRRRGVGELLEVLAEHRRQLARLLVVGIRVGPRRARIEQRRVDAGHRHRHLEAEG